MSPRGDCVTALPLRSGPGLAHNEELVPLGVDDRPVLARNTHRPMQLPSVVLPHRVPQLLCFPRVGPGRSSSRRACLWPCPRARTDGRRDRRATPQEETIGKCRALLEGKHERDEVFSYVHPARLRVNLEEPRVVLGGRRLVDPAVRPGQHAKICLREPDAIRGPDALSPARHAAMLQTTARSRTMDRRALQQVQ